MQDLVSDELILIKALSHYALNYVTDSSLAPLIINQSPPSSSPWPEHQKNVQPFWVQEKDQGCRLFQTRLLCMAELMQLWNTRYSISTAFWKCQTSWVCVACHPHGNKPTAEEKLILKQQKQVPIPRNHLNRENESIASWQINYIQHTM